MKNKFLLIPCVVFSQCIPKNDYTEKSFVKLKQEETKTATILSCSIKPVDDDIDLAHYKIFGVALRGDIECGRLKVAYKKQGNRLNYEIPLSCEEGIRLDKIYMPEKYKEKFKNGKACSFRLLFDQNKNVPRVMLKDGVLAKCKATDIVEHKEGQIKISIFVEHTNVKRVDKSSDEIVF